MLTENDLGVKDDIEVSTPCQNFKFVCNVILAYEFKVDK